MWTPAPDEIMAIQLSLKVAMVAALASLPFGICVAWILARLEFSGKSVLNTLVHLPLVLPPVVVGYLLLVLMGRKGVVGSWLEATFGLVFAFTWTGAALAAAVMSFPLLVRPIRLSIEAIDPRLEEAASTLGASRFMVAVLVTIPLALPGILAGFTLCFAKALGEFGATITFVSAIPGETQTISSMLYGYTQTPGADAGAIRLMLVSVLIAGGALLMSEWFAHRLSRRMSGR